jgi:putative glutamine amidotransferase
MELSDGGRLSLATDYTDAVTSAGGVPLLLPPVHSPADIERQVAMCDGFVFTGGRDINPARYGEQQQAQITPLNPRREDYDLGLLRSVLKSRKPILAVCLGCQELNVALGGTLLQDISTQTSSTLDHHQGDTRHEAAHEVTLTTGSRLADIVSTKTLAVNSIHHQACARLGRGVRISARAPDGTVEGYELRGHPFALAVQWHPESILHLPGQRQIYGALVRAAANRQNSQQLKGWK